VSQHTSPPGRSGYPRRLRIAALVLPSLLIAGLVALDYFLVERLFPVGVSHLVTLVIGVAGVLAFSTAVFNQLSALQARDRANTQQLRVIAEELELKRKQLQAVNAAGLALTSELDRDAVLQRVADQARLVANAKYAALGVFDEEGVVETFTTSGISPEERARIGPLPRGRGLLGHLQDERRPIRLRDLHAHPASVGFPKNHPPMTSFIGTPILLRGEPLGNLYLTEKQGAPEFTDADLEALETLAAQAAIAIENARLYEQIERVSVVEERHRIRMDLHDGVMQSLYGVGLLLEDVAERLQEEPEDSKATLGRAVDRLNAAIADLRGYVLGLRPVQASDQPLPESLALLADQARSNALIDVDVDIAPDAASRLDRARREAAYYIAADALGNIARHARARHASVRLFGNDGTVVLQITDDGVGFDFETSTTGHGLHNMRERAFAVGATLQVHSTPGAGARVRLELPAAPVTAK
jgi:two-component system, NarL family, sensor histidine kinase DevS